ncbi:glycosyltransferase [Ohtaekwangia kribbensis]|uniref:Glycosyltransferase n=1 Tax=Ohtaekwangia kribbensis TaxID=688913 RepID=A0ABW3K9R1_9BACT
MKILQLIQKPQLRGAEMFACQLSNHLLAMGHDVTVVCLLDGNAQLPFKGKLVNLKRPLSKRFFDVGGWKQLADYIKQNKPDIIQANAGDTLKFVVLSKLFFQWKTPIVYRNANKVSDFITSRPKLIFNKFLVKQLEHIISVSELCRLDFIKTYNVPSEKTTMVPIGIEAVAVNKTLSADILPYFTSGKVIVNVASLVPEKNHEALLRIATEVVKEYSDIKVLILGDGKLRESLQQKIMAMGLDNHVALLGYRADVLSILSNANVFTLPSRIEGLPGVILEAFYCEVPVVAYNVGGISEVVKNDETGWLVDKDDEQRFIVSVKDALLNSDKTSKIRKNAHQFVTREFMNDSIAKKFAAAYTKVLNSKSAV